MSGKTGIHSIATTKLDVYPRLSDSKRHQRAINGFVMCIVNHFARCLYSVS